MDAEVTWLTNDKIASFRMDRSILGQQWSQTLRSYGQSYSWQKAELAALTKALELRKGKRHDSQCVSATTYICGTTYL